jgi:hypothetical protein
VDTNRWGQDGNTANGEKSGRLRRRRRRRRSGQCMTLTPSRQWWSRQRKEGGRGGKGGK